MPRGGHRKGAGRKRLEGEAGNPVDRAGVANWCHRRQRDLQLEAAVAMAKNVRHEEADRKRDEIMQAYRGRPRSDAVQRIIEKVGPILDDAGRGLQVVLKRPYGLRKRVLAEASQRFGLPEATIDKEWKRLDARVRKMEDLRREPDF